ncbi:Uncharacterised protein [Staphylococcus aureus]|uniref:Uncharacterized protein n=1 Tax=Staphylococcus aureus TaxID=1280 RepID=A0A380DYX3_STAAU|nr:Uncharacterised protein [Staphylococcus aureus]
MDDKTKNDQQESNEDKDELDYLRGIHLRKDGKEKDQRLHIFLIKIKMIHLNKLILMKKYT